jgi:hypothetical protein
MTDPAFNLAQLAARPNWYDHLSQVERAMAEDDRIARIRRAAGWTTDEGGWLARDDTPESDWADNGYPFPEDPDYTAWASAFYHYEALDASPTV